MIENHARAETQPAHRPRAHVARSFRAVDHARDAQLAVATFPAREHAPGARGVFMLDEKRQAAVLAKAGQPISADDRSAGACDPRIGAGCATPLKDTDEDATMQTHATDARAPPLADSTQTRSRREIAATRIACYSCMSHRAHGSLELREQRRFDGPPPAAGPAAGPAGPPAVAVPPPRSRRATRCGHAAPRDRRQSPVAAPLSC